MINEIRTYRNNISKSLDNINKEIDIIYDNLNEIDYSLECDVINYDNFIEKLKIDNYELYEKILPFINDYMKYYNGD